MTRRMLLGTLGMAALCAVVGVQADEIVFSEDFVQRQNSPQQCTAWREFSAELVEQDYTLLTMRGSKDPDGVSCSNPEVIRAIAKALNTNNQARQSWACDGRTWWTGGCGGGVELSAANSICQCPNPEYIVRPCIGNSNWGGVNTATCGGDTQTMTVIFAASKNCFYTIKKSKPKQQCEACPPKGDDFRSEAECKTAKDCRKKVKTKINCPEGEGLCKIKAKKRRCE